MGTSLQPVHTLSPGANLGAYIQTVSGFDVLTAEEEKRLAEDLYYREDINAARQLVMSHLRFVVHIAKSYSGYGLNQADLVYPDGVGVVWASRFLGGCRLYKITGRDWITSLCDLAARNDLRLYILAGKPGIATKAKDRLLAQWPNLTIVGAYDGYFVEKNESQIIQDIDLKKPLILLVGMGVPRQEKGIADVRDRVSHEFTGQLAPCSITSPAKKPPSLPGWMPWPWNGYGACSSTRGGNGAVI